MNEPSAVPTPCSFDGHVRREVAFEGEFISLAAEVAALLNRHAGQIRQVTESGSQALVKLQRGIARGVQLVFHLEQAIGASEEHAAAVGFGKTLRRFRIIKDQLKDQLAAQGFTWRDPTGEEFTQELAELVEVDGWRHAAEYAREVVVETREPIVLYQGQPVLVGAVVVGAPE
jgi:molecular chaperone GrpE (heat shock protein)